MKKKTKIYLANAEEMAKAEAFFEKMEQERKNAIKNETREGNFYVEFNYEGSDEPYVVQTKMFKTIKSAKQFIRRNFDFIDFNLIQISIMEEIDNDLQHYAIATALRIKSRKDLKILSSKTKKEEDY